MCNYDQDSFEWNGMPDSMTCFCLLTCSKNSILSGFIMLRSSLDKCWFCVLLWCDRRRHGARYGAKSHSNMVVLYGLTPTPKTQCGLYLVADRTVKAPSCSRQVLLFSSHKLLFPLTIITEMNLQF